MDSADALLRELRDLNGSPPSAIKRTAQAWLARWKGEALPLTLLDQLFRSGLGEGRLAAMELSLAKSGEWNKKWGGLFLRWARTQDSSHVIADVLGPRLMGPLWLSGDIEARQMVALSIAPDLWPWRTGLTALAPSFAKNADDQPLFEQFLKACLGEESRFHQERAAFQGVLLVLRVALPSRSEEVLSWVDRHEPELPSFLVMAVRSKTGRLEECES